MFKLPQIYTGLNPIDYICPMFCRFYVVRLVVIAVTLVLITSSHEMLYAQSWTNPSFEAEPQEAFVPVGWTPCSPQTTPDIFPGVWGVQIDPAQGKSYMGLITRSDGSNESVGQRIPLKLEKERCYFFSFFLSTADTYAGFNDPIRCRIWLGSSSCRREQLLFESAPLEEPDWEKIVVRFTPEIEGKFIIIEAGFPSPAQKARGNILVDGISPILPCDRT